MFSSPGEVAFSIGNFEIYYYGIILSLAALSGVYISYFIARKFYDVDAEKVFSVATVVIIAGILFARVYYCLLNFNYYSAHPFEILDIRGGGLSIQGGIFGAFICGMIYAKINNLNLFRFADIISYGLVWAQSLGRWGNFFNSEAFGTPTQSFLGVFIPLSKRPVEFITSSYFHPTFLYESIANLIIFCILFFIVRKKVKHIDGLVFMSYLILYSTARFFIEGIRTDSALNVGVYPIAQIICIITILIAIVTSIFLVKFPNRR